MPKETETTTFIVTEKAMRPASDKRQCFYCQQTIGEPHKADCVLITKRVKLRTVIEYEDEVPADWDREMIEFHRNDSSWCADNLLKKLENISEKNGCLCPIQHTVYLGMTSEAFLDE